MTYHEDFDPQKTMMKRAIIESKTNDKKETNQEENQSEEDDLYLIAKMEEEIDQKFYLNNLKKLYKITKISKRKIRMYT